MNRIVIGIVLVVVMVSTFLYFTKTLPRPAGILYVNGIIYTFDGNNTVAQALAIRGNHIVGIGTSEEIQSRFHADTIIDLHGKTVLPGLIDGHAHMNGLGDLMHSILLFGAPSIDEVVRVVKERCYHAQPGEWIQGRGWDQNLWTTKEFPTAEMLNAVSPNNPVILIRVDGHAIWVNQKAMEIAGVTRETKDPDGGKIVRDAKGNPTGIFVEDNARELIESHLPPVTETDIEQNLLKAADECLKVGLTEVGDMAIDSIEIAAYQYLAETDRLPIRIYGSIISPSSAWNDWQHRAPLIGYGHGMLTIRGMKMFADGALGSRGAALVDEYSDDPGNRGTTVTSEEELDREFRIAFQNGYQPMVHAIGDRANHIVLNAYQKVLSSIPPADYRPRIEHAQVLLPEDIPRFKQLNILPSMQPVHATSDMYWAESRLGPKRILGAYAWRSILQTGSIIIGGSDFPDDAMNPLWGIYAAITRSDRDGYPQDGWYREQRMTREEAVRCYTQWASYGLFQEYSKGTIEQGKLADLTILSKDIMKIPPSEILSTDVEMTIIDGKIVYQKSQTN